MTDLLTADEGQIRMLTLNRPEKRNALNSGLVSALKDALNESDNEENLRAIVIRGAGKDFCSGADLAELQKISGNTYDENLDDARSLAHLFSLIRSVKIPVIAAVHGRALAGGCGLATACDLIVSTESARFGYPEVKIGFVPAIVTAFLRRNISEKHAFEMITQGFEFSAQRAYEIGLVNQLFEEESFEEAVHNYAFVYEKVSRSAVIMSKELLYRMDGQQFGESMDAGTEVNARARMTDDCQKGIAKFLNRMGDDRG